MAEKLEQYTLLNDGAKPLGKSYICITCGEFLSLKIMAYYSVIFCNKFGEFFSLEIMAYYSVIFCNKFGDFFSLKILGIL